MDDESPSWLNDDSPFGDSSVTEAAAARLSNAPVPQPSTAPPPVAASGMADDAPPAWLSNPPPPTAQQLQGAQAGATQVAGAVDQRAVNQAMQGNTNGAGQTIAYNIAQQQAQMQYDGVKKDLGDMPNAWKLMKFLNLVNAVLAGTAIYLYLSEKEVTSYTIDAYVIGMYVMAFALLMCCYESVGLFSFVAVILADNFGFMYTITGRVTFMVMLNCMLFVSKDTFAICVAAFGLATALFNGGVMVYYSDWTAKMVEDMREATEKQQR